MLHQDCFNLAQLNAKATNFHLLVCAPKQLDLAMVGGYLDVALRDLGLCLGALALARLAEAEAVAGARA